MEENYKRSGIKKARGYSFQIILPGKFPLPYLLILITCFILYGNTLLNDYTLDDKIVILQNQFTKKGFGGIGDILKYDSFAGFFGKQTNYVAGGRYRPLSLVTFAIEYAFFGENTFISHLINILLYTLTCIILYSVLRKLLQKYDSNRKWLLSVSFIATILFAAHPLHTEVIANIKGRDEIMTLLGSLAVMYYSLRYLETNRAVYLYANLLIFSLALMSKENAVTFIAIIPFALYFFTKSGVKKYLAILTPLAIATLIYLIIRHMVLGSFRLPESHELMNNPFIDTNESEKLATTIYTWGLYLKLLLFPHPLTYDYYPKQIPIVNFSDVRVLISLIAYMFLAAVAFFGIKKKRLVAFGILFFAASFSLVSNLFFNVGTFMNERFMYISSIGFCIILAYILISGLQKILKPDKIYRNVVSSILLLIIGLYSVKTIVRNTVWKNNYTLFTHDVKISPNSAKGNCATGSVFMNEFIKIRNIKQESSSFAALKQKIRNETSLGKQEKQRILKSGNLEKAGIEIDSVEEKMRKLSVYYIEKALDIYHDYNDARLLLSKAPVEFDRNYKGAINNYMELLKRNPNSDPIYSDLEKVINAFKSVDLKINTWQEILKLNPNRFEPNYYLGNLYGKFKNDMQKAIPYLLRAVKIKPTSVVAYKDLGAAYGVSHMYEKSIEVLKKAFKLDSTDAQIMANIGISYHFMGQEVKAQECFKKAKSINPDFIIPQ